MSLTGGEATRRTGPPSNSGSCSDETEAVPLTAGGGTLAIDVGAGAGKGVEGLEESPKGKRRETVGMRKRRKVAFAALALLAAFSILAAGYFDLLSMTMGVARFFGHGDREYTTRFIVIGDWGRKGIKEQTAVARAMGAVASALLPNFVVSVGDNFYPSGLTMAGMNATWQENRAHILKAFDESFTQVYNHPALQVEWHAIMGNHDYGDGAKDGEVLNPATESLPLLMEVDRRWHCCGGVDFTQLEHGARGDDVGLFFLDTSPFIEKYHRNVTEYNWTKAKGGLASKWDHTQAQVDQLERELQQSQARWKLVFGHHPVYSTGEHGDMQEMEAMLHELLLRNNVSLYINGHDHNLADIVSRRDSDAVPGTRESEGIHYITSGAGSLVRKDAVQTSQLSRFHQGEPGFITVAASRDRLRVQFYRCARWWGERVAIDATKVHEFVLAA